LDLLEAKIRDRSANIGVIGLGYVGLPLAVAFAEAGYRVTGFDNEQSKVVSVNQGLSYVDDVGNQRLSSVTAGGLLEATSDKSRLREIDTISICVPTPLTATREPDLSYVLHESETIAGYLRPGQLIILESTTFPGTTRTLVLPTLEGTGLREGSDFYLAYSPERVDPGTKGRDLKKTTRIVSGLSDGSTRLAVLLYKQVIETVVAVSSPEVAEMSKEFENVFRIVNIALTNELAQLCDRMGISAWEVIDAASTKPFGFMPFYPGPGVGGHCIPVDPHYLASKAREYGFRTRFIELAAEINEGMPGYTVSRIEEALTARGGTLQGARIMVLGVTYKQDVADTRESPALKLIQQLEEHGAEVSHNDPYIREVRLNGHCRNSVEITKDLLSSMDCVVIATAHKCYDPGQIAAWSNLVFDTRGVTNTLKVNNVVRLGG
jgi:UDP-N-acetyl-D-glucosamine dehydrogenase